MMKLTPQEIQDIGANFGIGPSSAEKFAAALSRQAAPVVAASELSDEQIQQIANIHFYEGPAGTMDIRVRKLARAVLAAATPAASVLTDGEITGAAELHADDISGTGDYGTYTFDRDGLLSFVRAVRYAESCAAPAVQHPAEGGWISVKDQLPESPYQKVIVWVQMFYAPSYMHVGTCNAGKWNFDDSRLGEVTYWQPMPAAPLPAAPTQAEGHSHE